YYWGPGPKDNLKHTNRRINSRGLVTKTPLETRPATLNILATKKLSRSDLINLQVAGETIDRFLSDPDEKYVDALRKTIANLPFRNVNREFIRLSKIITHLDSLLDAPKAGINALEGILLDAEAPSTRWRNEDFDLHILRGITAVMRSRAASNGRGIQAKGRSYSLERDYPFKKNPHVVGHNGLVVGQWWLLQICLLRDGAHGEIEGGISGNKEFGAFSVIISGSSYKDEDHGNTVFYCGTRGTLRALDENEDVKVKIKGPETQKRVLGTPSSGTQLLLTACKRETPVRLHRSCKAVCKSRFAPQKGIRYDGLYDVTGYAILDHDYAMLRFTLVRRTDQPEMRWKGAGVRPNAEELGPNGWSEVQRLLKGTL
ncbi:hypothetical protein RUND412_011186, partial [Rhizina undulata]